MKHFYSQIKKTLSIALFLGIFLQSYVGNSQNLNPGDILFTGYDATIGTGDSFSFVALVTIPANTVIRFTDRGYFSPGTWQADTASGSEGTITWTTGTAISPGAEIIITGLTASVFNPLTNGLTTNGSIAVSDPIMTQGLSLSTVGDQIIAFQGGSGSVTDGGVVLIAGLHYYNCPPNNTSTAAWDSGACANGTNGSKLPPGLTGGTNAFFTGPGGTGTPAAAKFNSASGAQVNTIANIRTSIMNSANWTTSAGSITMPSAASFLGSPPVVTTTAATNVKALSATMGGDVTDDGGDAAVERGIVWALAPNPTTLNNKFQIGTGPNAFSGTVTGLTAGSLIYYRAYAKNTTATTYGAELTLTTGAELSAPATIPKTNVSCNGGGNGTATVVPTGGSTPYTYSWSPSGGTNATATGLSVGVYTVTVTDGEGTQITRSATITQPAAFNITTSKTDVSCNGGGNGTATVNVTGGTPSYTYSWAPSGGTNATATGLSAGTYTVTITDANACQATRTFTIAQPTVLSATASKTDVSCFGGSNGTATAHPTGGTPGYTYSWAPSGGTAATATGLAAGTYTVTITDANACQTTATATVGQPAAALTATASSQTNILCRGAATGSATVAVTGGTGTYTYSWAPAGGTAATASSLTAGTYTVTVTDANACQTTQSFTITEPTTDLTASVGTVVNVSCKGDATGQATVNAAGGTGAYTYSWAPSGGTAATATGLAAGTYTVTVTDANACTATQTFTISEPANALTATAGAINNVSCNGGANGTATVNVTGGTGARTYSWAPFGGTNATATGLSAGTYTVTVTDANACTATQNFTISQPTALTASIGSQTNVSCNGGANGTATVSVTGGTGIYTYSWAPSGGTAATATGLAAGTYTVTVTDANVCQATQSFTISQPVILSATQSQTDVLCNGSSTGTATVVASGGTGVYTYSWAPSGGTAATATGLAVGNYTVTITDANACSINKNFTILQPPTLTATTSQINATCSTPGEAGVIPAGGTTPYSYLWSDGQATQTATGLTAGNYSVIITDANGCTISKNFTITTTNTLVATTSQTDLLCNGANTGSASVLPSGAVGPFTYVWAPSGGTADTATGLAAGNYSVTITAGNGCSIVKNFTINQPSALTITPSQTNVSCNGGSNGSATATVTGGAGAYTYSWAPSGGTAATATGLAAGDYTLTVGDANGCIKMETYTITQPDALIPSITKTDVSCNGGSNGSATVSVTGGTGAYTYLWSPSGGTGATASGLTAGNYTVTIKDANLCETTAIVLIEEPTLLTATIEKTDVLCNQANNGTATVTATGGTGNYTYLWSPSGGTAATATGLSPNTYTVQVTDENGCFITKTIEITEPTALSTIDSHVNATCNGGNNGTASVVTTGGTGNYSYLWAPSGGTAATATGLTAGTYTVTVTDENSCSTVNTITITEPDALTLTATSVDVSCHNGNNGSASVTATGGTGAYTYSWSPSGGTAATATGLTAGTYTVTVTDANSCTATNTFVITEPDALTLTATSVNVSCHNGNNGSATVSVTGGTGAYTYSWSPSGGTAATATGLTAGVYTVTVTDANSCSETNTITITEPDALTLTTTSVNISCHNENNGSATVNATGGTGSYSYSWLPTGGTEATATNLTAGTYTVTVTDANSCSETNTIVISEPDALTLTATSVDVLCHNGNNGSASVTVAGGTGAYTYSWSPSGGTAATATGLTAGIYTVIVTDSNSCVITTTIEIAQPENPVNLSTSDVTEITTTGASLSGTASSDGINTDKGECLTEVGFVYALHANPTTADTKINVTAALGTFTNALSGLRGNRTYYVRTYAVNSNGYINYGNEVSFTTQKYTLSITAKAGLSKVYGKTDPVFNYTPLGFVNGDTSAIITGLLSRDAGEDVGKYNITLGSISAGTDYIIDFTGAEFEIIKADQTITWNQSLELGCSDSNTLTLTATTDSGLPVSYTIANTALGTISGTTLTITGAGSTTVTAVQNGDQNHNAATTVIKPLEISQSGIVVQQWANVLFFDNKSNDFVAWQWYKNGAAVSGATRQYYSEVLPLNGTYYVIAKDKNGNSIKSCPIETTGSVFSKKIKIYPNPVKPGAEFTLECDFSESQLNGSEVVIYDITGKLVQTISNVKAKNQIIAPSQVALYVVVLKLADGQLKTINLLVK